MANEIVHQLPHVDRIQGASLEGGPQPEESRIVVQYADPGGTEHELPMPFLEGMQLLTYLKAIQHNRGFAVPDDPRG